MSDPPVDYVNSVGRLDPESPDRLRQCLAALAEYKSAHVLRLEVELGPSTRSDGNAITMTVTHSLGFEQEAAIGPVLANAFAAALDALAKRAALPTGSPAPSGENGGNDGR